MSPVLDFDDVYARSRPGLLVQLYAYCGDGPAAADALDEAFTSACAHWHRLREVESVDSWLRDRAVRRLDRLPKVQRDRPRPDADNTRLLAALAALDPVSRRLVVVRRLGDVDLEPAARDAGLALPEAEQALARALSALHAAGVDTTPSGLDRSLRALESDLRLVPPGDPAQLRRAGTRRRYAAGAAVVVAIVLVAAVAGLVRSGGPSAPGTALPPASPPRTIATPTPPATQPPRLGAADLLTAELVSSAGGAAEWHRLPWRAPPVAMSVYGDCLDAADNPPPDTSWVGDLVSGSGRARTRLREVLQLAPTDAEAIRAYRQVVGSFSVCGGRQLSGFARVRGLGERAHLVELRIPGHAGPRLQTVVAVQTGSAVVTVIVTSAPGGAAELTSSQLIAVSAAAVNRVCTTTGSRCAAAPYHAVDEEPPPDPSTGRFLSVVDLPLMPHVAQQWIATPARAGGPTPPAAACGVSGLSSAGATGASTRSYVVPGAAHLPKGFGVHETVGTFASSAAARRYLTSTAHLVAKCHRRHRDVVVSATARFAGHRAAGRIWEIRERTARRTDIVRLGLVRFTHTVGDVVFEPAATSDVTRPDYVALARRAALRLGQ